jgi:hypothetical protein
MATTTIVDNITSQDSRFVFKIRLVGARIFVDHNAEFERLEGYDTVTATWLQVGTLGNYVWNKTDLVWELKT